MSASKIPGLLAEVAEYESTPQWRLCAMLFEAMADEYRHDLVDVSADELPRKQALAKQMVALAELFAGKPNSDPRL